MKPAPPKIRTERFVEEALMLIPTPPTHARSVEASLLLYGHGPAATRANPPAQKFPRESSPAANSPETCERSKYRQSNGGCRPPGKLPAASARYPRRACARSLAPLAKP